MSDEGNIGPAVAQNVREGISNDVGRDIDASTADAVNKIEHPTDLQAAKDKNPQDIKIEHTDENPDIPTNTKTEELSENREQNISNIDLNEIGTKAGNEALQKSDNYQQQDDPQKRAADARTEIQQTVELTVGSHATDQTLGGRNMPEQDAFAALEITSPEMASAIQAMGNNEASLAEIGAPSSAPTVDNATITSSQSQSRN